MKKRVCFNCGKTLQGYNNTTSKTKYDTCHKCEDKLQDKEATTISPYKVNNSNSDGEKAPIKENDIKAILQGLKVVVDSREQQNSHILEYFKSKKILYVVKKLDSGDYSFELSASPEHGIFAPISFENKIFIERKNSLEELSGNFCNGRERFNKEFSRTVADCRKILIIERGSIDDILNENYRTGFDAKAYLASLLSFKCRYIIDIHFVSKENAGRFIYALFYYEAREFLKGDSDN